MAREEYCYKYPRAALAVDCVVFGLDEKDSLKLLLIRRRKPPFEEQWALPGGYVRVDRADEDLSLEAAARRELREETGADLDNVFLEQLYTFGSKERDPRGWTATVSYYALVNIVEYSLEAATDASATEWFDINNLPQLAFDHKRIVHAAISRLRGKVRYEPIGFELLPQKFTLPQLLKLYETILDKKLDKRNFLRKFHKMGLLNALDETQEGVSHRPAKLYQFNELKYKDLKERGFNFEI